MVTRLSTDSISLFFRRAFARLDGRLRLILVAVVVGVFGGFASVALNFGLTHGAAFLRPFWGKWYAVRHDALAVIGAYGHGVVKEVLFGSFMEHIHTMLPNNLLLVGPKYRGL